MQSKKIVKLLFTFVVLALFTASAFAADLNQKVASGKFVQKVNAFAVIYDTTLSMNDAYKSGTKLSQQKALITLLANTIPDLKLNSVGQAFGQFKSFGASTSKPLFGPEAYSKSTLPAAIAPYKAGVGFSPLSAALNGAASDLRSQSGRLAIIAFSDGEDMQEFKPVAAAQQVKSEFGDRICIYTVHLGDSPAGRKTMQEVADASRCGFMVTGDSIATEDAMADFVEKVFLEAKKPEPVKAAAPPPPVVREVVREKEAAPVVAPVAKPAPAPEKVTMTLNIQFDTNKAVIKKKYHDEVKKVADFMKEYPKTSAVIEGHTDNVGKMKANIALSQKRAESVKSYLINKFGIETYRLSAYGYGPSKPIASNKTAAGRQQNRRVEAQFEAVVKK